MKSDGWMGCAIEAADGSFMAAQISEDRDGICRFHINRTEERFATAQGAVDFARGTRSTGAYWSWSSHYRIEPLV